MSEEFESIKEGLEDAIEMATEQPELFPLEEITNELPKPLTSKELARQAIAEYYKNKRK